MVAEGDVLRLVAIFKAYKHNFWSRVFEEYLILPKRLMLESMKNRKTKLVIEKGRPKLRVFGNLYNSKIKERNEKEKIQRNDENISIDI